MSEDYLDRFEDRLEATEIRALRRQRRPSLESPELAEIRTAVSRSPEVETAHRIFDRPVVEIGRTSEIAPEASTRLLEALRAFVPWKKGPFRVFGHGIDAEWRSDRKWSRIESVMSPLAGRRIADVGCHNGYFMFRMAAHEPELVVGFEPMAKHALAFDLLQKYARVPSLAYELLGVEHLHHYPCFFDTVFCLGILYHHRDPLGLLEKVHRSLAPGGEIIVDCQGIVGEEPVAWMPPGRYARARGVWFLPTRSCLQNWLRRSRFVDVDTFYAAPLSTAEQRRTEWAPIDSLAEFLDPHDPTRTVEGHPAPWRIYARARKG
ncbi:MAG: tRNA 5-methoxyuridine(34)/uridine 5-oxyacetic acid(34) synthase CmoB [Planctomycetes bacterium]|nr:tRNA 5-methoxyuridine(34)/uridine 5-oxyacetic acid(34) synthase CmoB [Planctomycetota bacterium]